MIETLLKTDFVRYLNNRQLGKLPTWIKTPVVSQEDIIDKIFDIVDLRGAGGSIKRPNGAGEATYHNNGLYIPCFIKYDDFLTQFRIYNASRRIIMDWAEGIKRADFLVYDKSEEKKFFIIHELSKGSKRNKKAKGIKQLLDTIATLWGQVNIKTYITSTFKNLFCYISMKRCAKSTPSSIADGFLEIYKQLPNAIAIPNPEFGLMGFKAFETNEVEL